MKKKKIQNTNEIKINVNTLKFNNKVIQLYKKVINPLIYLALENDRAMFI